MRHEVPRRMFPSNRREKWNRFCIDNCEFLWVLLFPWSVTSFHRGDPNRLVDHNDLFRDNSEVESCIFFDSEKVGQNTRITFSETGGDRDCITRRNRTRWSTELMTGISCKTKKNHSYKIPASSSHETVYTHAQAVAEITDDRKACASEGECLKWMDDWHGSLWNCCLRDTAWTRQLNERTSRKIMQLENPLIQEGTMIKMEKH